MNKAPLWMLACTILSGCGQDASDKVETPPPPVLVKDTEARDLIGKVKSVTSASWQEPTSSDSSISFDSLFSKVTKHIAKYNANSDPSFVIDEADAREANRAHIQRDAFDTSGNMVFLAQHKKMWKPRRAVRSADAIAYFDTTLDRNIFYHDTTILNKDRSIGLIIDEFITVTDSVRLVKTRLVRRNILRNDSVVVWIYTTNIFGDIPKPEPTQTDTVTYKILGKDVKGNLLKALVSHSDKRQPDELILYKYTYYE